MLNSIAAGRRMAARIVLAQIGTALLAGALFALDGSRAAAAAFAGGAIVALGTALHAMRAFSGGYAGAGYALARSFAGLLIKWLVVLGGLYLVVARWGLPPLPATIGMGAALLAQLAGLTFKD